MTGRLQLIEQKLHAIDPAGFQNLCDAYITLREKEYSSLSRTGSQLGKQKTVLGTPDSFIRLKDNRLAYIEYTTQTESIVSKIKGDIDKCLDKSKTKVSPKSIYLIIICFNSRLTVEEETEIQSYADSLNKRIELIGIDTLALEILSKYVLLSRDYLDIPTDTGQILPFDKFIAEYDNKGNQLSTPLNNEFFNRKDELNEILEYLKTGDLILLSGAPGVGKTKLGIEAVSKFIEINPDFTSFAISKKDVDIYEDLRIQLSVDKNYILLIDDANRQLSNLTQILGIFKEERKGNIKIIITVRNYALTDINKITDTLQKSIIELNKFTDEEIIKIIASDSFKILHSKFQNKIVEISDGNARLAVMAARLANEKQSEFLWGDVSDLFDSYFDKFISDFDLFENIAALKTLGIVSFFFTINRENKQFIETILQLFEISYYDFNEALEELHERELIEIQYNHARVSEQVMATYFFYKVFIKDNYLSFKTLLFNFFADWKPRFKDSIISSNNSFGYENVIKKIGGDLSDYLNQISEDEKLVLDFLDLFWFYKQEDTINFFYEKVNNLPEPESPIYITHYETNDFVYDRERKLDFISRFFNYLGDWFEPSIKLGFEYVRKKPEHLPEFIRRIRENLLFDEPDERIGFERQVRFIDMLIENFKQEEPHYVSAFFALANSFLAHSFRHSQSGRKHSFVLYNYPLPFYNVTIELREKIWQTLFNSYNKYPDDVFDVIKNYKPSHYDLVPEIMDYDLTLLVQFISEQFSPNIFKHAYFVQDMIYWTDREQEISNRTYRDLKHKFLTEDYLIFCKLDWNRLKDKNDFDFNNWEEYDNLKSDEIKKNFLFKNETEFNKLILSIRNYLSVKGKNDESLNRSIDIIIEENFKQNQELGFQLLSKILRTYPKDLPFLHSSVRAISNFSESWCLQLWNEIEDWTNENSLFWRTRFFTYIPDNFINEYYLEKLIETINSINKYVYLNIESYSRFTLKDKNITQTILIIVADKIDKQNIRVDIRDDIFEKSLNLFNSDYDLIRRCYFQQYRYSSTTSFDYNRKGFEEILNAYPEFLVDFLREFFTDSNLNKEDRDIKLGFIWKYKLSDEFIRASDFLIENNLYLGLGDHAHTILFKEIEAEYSNIAFNFLKERIETYKMDSERLTIYFDTIRGNFDNEFETAVLLFLSVNTDINIFRKIDWVGNVGVQWGDVNFGVLYAKRWERILNIVNKFDDSLAMIPIKAYLKKKIAEQYRRAEQEREMKFLRPDW